MTGGTRTSSTTYPNFRRRGKRLGPPWSHVTNATVSDLICSEAAKQGRTEIGLPAEGATVNSGRKTVPQVNDHPNKQGSTGDVNESRQRYLGADAANVGLMGLVDDGSTRKTSSWRGRKKSVRQVNDTSEEPGYYSAFRQNSFDIVLNRSTQLHSGTEGTDADATGEEDAYYAIEL